MSSIPIKFCANFKHVDPESIIITSPRLTRLVANPAIRSFSFIFIFSFSERAKPEYNA